MLTAGALIWVSVRPLLRLVLSTTAGFVITKLDIFPLVATRGAGQIILNIAYPCLMFSKIVPAFTPDNVKSLGPLVLVAFLYEFIGIATAWVVKQFCWVPHRFRYGIFVAGGWSNYGDVPTAVVMSITGAAPFNASTDQTLSVAYISAFILVFFVTFFPMGGHRLIQLDYVGPEVEDDEVRMPIVAKAKDSFRGWIRGISRIYHIVQIRRGEVHSDAITEKQPELDIEKLSSDYPARTTLQEVSNELDQLNSSAKLSGKKPELFNAASKHVSFYPDDTTVALTEVGASRLCSAVHTETFPSRVASPVPSDTRIEDESCPHSPYPRISSPLSSRKLPAAVPESVGPSTIALSRSRKLSHRALARTRTVVNQLLTPQAISILVAFPVALITPLKALFVEVANSPIPNAPDGQPPLAFILDTCTFIGAASVPLGLICLGSALARLHIPRDQWGTLPLSAISWLAIGKMLVMPVLGVLITEGLVHVGLIEQDQKALRFVCMFMSCVPTATTQVYLTQVYSGTGEAGVLAAFLIPQYALMFLSMTALIAYSVSLLF